MYNKTPANTNDVPRADNPVTRLSNSSTESQINKALFAVFATLQKKTIIRKLVHDERFSSSKNAFEPDFPSVFQRLPVRNWTDVIHKYVSCDALKMEENSVEKKDGKEFEAERLLEPWQIN